MTGRVRQDAQPDVHARDSTTNTINLLSGSEKLPLGMLQEEIQHAMDHAVNLALNNLTWMTNGKLHAGPFARVAENQLFGQTQSQPQQQALLAASRTLSGK